MRRRKPIVKAGGALAPATAAVTVDAPNVVDQQKTIAHVHDLDSALDVLQGAAQTMGQARRTRSAATG